MIAGLDKNPEAKATDSNPTAQQVLRKFTGRYGFDAECVRAIEHIVLGYLGKKSSMIKPKDFQIIESSIKENPHINECLQSRRSESKMGVRTKSVYDTLAYARQSNASIASTQRSSSVVNGGKMLLKLPDGNSILHQQPPVEKQSYTTKMDTLDHGVKIKDKNSKFLRGQYNSKSIQLEQMPITNVRQDYDTLPCEQIQKPVRDIHASPSVDHKAARKMSHQGVRSQTTMPTVYQTSPTPTQSYQKALMTKSQVELRRGCNMEEAIPQRVATFGLGNAYHNVEYEKRYKKGKRLFPQGPHIQAPMIDPHVHHPTTLNIGHYHGAILADDPYSANKGIPTIGTSNSRIEELGKIWGTDKQSTYHIKRAEDEWASVLKADLQQKQENENNARDSKNFNLRRYHADLTSQISQNLAKRDMNADHKRKEKHYSDLLLNRMQADTRAEEGNYLAQQRRYMQNRTFKEQAISAARKEMAVKQAVDFDANRIHFGEKMPFRPAVEIDFEGRSRDLAKQALFANQEFAKYRMDTKAVTPNAQEDPAKLNDFPNRHMENNLADRIRITKEHQELRDSMETKFLRGLVGNQKMDNPLVSFHEKDKQAETRAECEMRMIHQREDAKMYAERLRSQEMRTIEQKWSNEAKQLAKIKVNDIQTRATVERDSVVAYGKALKGIQDAKNEANLKRIDKEMAYREDLKKQILQKRQADFFEQTKLSSVEYNVNKKHADKANMQFYNQSKNQLNNTADSMPAVAKREGTYGNRQKL